MSKPERKLNICGNPLAPPVDTTDDDLMVREELRNPLLIINRSVFEKSQSEKKELKKVRSKKKLNSIPNYKKRDSLVKLSLIVYTKYSKVEKYKSTHSFDCIKEDVPSILTQLIDQGYKIHKVYFNNQRYTL